MSKGKQIRLFLTDGSASGIRYAELVNWTGQAMACPKALFTKLREWPETQRPGVYVLVGLNETGQESVYIGEGGSVLDRLLWHMSQSKLDDIVEAFFFTSKDDNLTKGHVTYLEQKLIKRAEDAKRYVVVYGREPSEKTLSKPEVATMEEFLENLYLIAEAMGYSVFEIAPPEQSTPEDASLFALSLEEGVTATGYQSEEGFVVKAGSTAVVGDAPSLQAGYKALKGDLRSKGVLISEGGCLKFAEDYAFKSPSAAAGIVSGAQRSGPQSWKRQADGKTLREVEVEKAEADAESLSEITAAGVVTVEDAIAFASAAEPVLRHPAEVGEPAPVTEPSEGHDGDTA